MKGLLDWELTLPCSASIPKMLDGLKGRTHACKNETICLERLL